MKDGPVVSFSGNGGTVLWLGNAPGPRTLVIDAEASKGCHEGGPVDSTDRSLLVDILGGVANVVIEVEGAQAEVGDDPYVMDQEGCRYEPHVLVVPAGATVEYRNSDSVGHNVHTYARRNDSMNKTVAANGGETQVYAKTDQIEVKCDIHPWMRAWVVVSDASLFAVSGSDGSFELPGLPPGEHKVSCWHEELGKASGKIVVGEDGSIAELDLALTKKR
ncbi:MAG TPA: carboxypeptidase regulatory-like domain-containing protein [Planctomycetota bacterium]|nr:carboxypeptidase regulatory-like domain-containing protein [Planctomycetota bacterium]